jgi:hypothetical protein
MQSTQRQNQPITQLRGPRHLHQKQTQVPTRQRTHLMVHVQDQYPSGHPSKSGPSLTPKAPPICRPNRNSISHRKDSLRQLPFRPEVSIILPVPFHGFLQIFRFNQPTLPIPQITLRPTTAPPKSMQPPQNSLIGKLSH